MDVNQTGTAGVAGVSISAPGVAGIAGGPGGSVSLSNSGNGVDTTNTTEATTPYRVINWHACNSCWNDVRERFDHKNFPWCPRHAGTPRQFECTRLIAAEQLN
jgi:hypothetical protein